MIGKHVLTLGGKPLQVKEETPRLWIAHEIQKDYILWRWRFPKKGGDAREARNERSWTQLVFLTEEARQAAVREQEERHWVNKNSWYIGNQIRHWRGDPAILRQVAALIGYDEKLNKYKP